jgi:hypothetical protein
MSHSHSHHLLTYSYNINHGKSWNKMESCAMLDAEGSGTQPFFCRVDYLCEECVLRCCCCSVCTCSSSSLIRRSLFANCFLRSFSSSHCREYALCNCNTEPRHILSPALFIPHNELEANTTYLSAQASQKHMNTT